jgi:phage antirepressor YoqD-like protein
MVVAICNTALNVKEYQGKRVVTFKDVDTVHGRPEGTARRNFNTNKAHFIEGEDFFKVCADEIRTHKIMEISPKAQEDVTLITESGYLMLVKSFTDELAWKVQRELVNYYFRTAQKDSYQIEDPIERAKRWIEEQQEKKQLSAKVSSLTVDNAIMQPKADYFDQLVDRNLLTNLRDTAKELQIKQNAFVSFLLEKKYMYRDQKGKLMPYSKHVDAGLFEIKEFTNEKTGFSSTQALITPKGRETFRLLITGS